MPRKIASGCIHDFCHQTTTDFYILAVVCCSLKQFEDMNQPLSSQEASMNLKTLYSCLHHLLRMLLPERISAGLMCFPIGEQNNQARMSRIGH
jgi:hypothetical protein